MRRQALKDAFEGGAGTSTPDGSAETKQTDAQAFRDAQKEAQRVERQMNRMSQDIENLEAELEELSQTAAPTEQDVAQMAELARSSLTCVRSTKSWNCSG